MNAKTNQIAQDFEARANTGKSAKYVVLLIAAIAAKITAENTTESVAKQTVRHGNRLISAAKRLNSLNVVQSVADMLNNAYNIKAFDYTAVLASGSMNNYLALTIEHIRATEQPTTESLAKHLAQYYSAGTVSAQKSMCVNALRAVQAIEATSSPKSPITQGQNWVDFAQQADGFVVSRGKLS